jgi:hypothetical protein
MNGRARSRDDATRPVAGRVRRSLRPPCAGRIVARRFRGQTGAGPPQNADFETDQSGISARAGTARSTEVGSGAGFGRRVDPLEVVLEHPTGAEGGSQRAHRGADAGEPRVWEPVRVAVIEGGHDLLLERSEEGGGVACVLRRVVGVDFARERPAVGLVVGFCLPAVERAEVQAAVDDRFHPAGPAALSRWPPLAGGIFRTIDRRRGR